jgi:hypothetical protein
MTRRVSDPPKALPWKALGYDWVQAAGARGVYRVRLTDRQWVLTATGHDLLPLIDLPASGDRFASMKLAKMRAEKLDVLPEPGQCGVV